ncbi:MAG: hypothetical protein FJ125_02460 [Deltaproteobacteria bacterium]|nr:hypothetical protein [Deltaproteobacteria bacterium]
MATTVTLEAELVEEVISATHELTKAAAVRHALREYLRLSRLRELAELAGCVELAWTNRELEELEEGGQSEGGSAPGEQR